MGFEEGGGGGGGGVWSVEELRLESGFDRVERVEGEVYGQSGECSG